MNVAIRLVGLVMMVLLVLWSGTEVARTLREAEIVQQELQRDHRILGLALQVAIERLDDDEGLAEARQLLEDMELAEREIELSLVAAPTAFEQRVVGDALVTDVPLELGDEAATLTLTEPLDEVTVVLRQGRRNMVLRGAFMVFIGTLLTAVGGRWLVGRRLDALVDRTRSMGRGDLTPRELPEPKDEIGVLATALEEMAGDLKRAREQATSEQEARLRTEQQLRHADRLRLVGDMSAGVAHELGSPLHVIAGSARLLAESRQLDDDQREIAGDIRAQALRMRDLVSRLLDLSHPHPPPPQATPLPRMMEDAVITARGLVRDTAVKLTIDPPPDVLVRFRPSLWTQIVANLIRNAEQAQSGEGTIHIGFSASDDEVCMVVEDAGPGVPEQDKPRLFDPFFTTKPAGEGVGLGLPLVRGILEEAGGRIEADDSPLGGARFRVYLPLASLEAP